MKKSLLLLLSLFALYGQTFAQGRVIRGRVTDTRDGAPLPGVTVIIKGTTTGSNTDDDGAYQITLPAQSSGVLVFRFVGYETHEQRVGTGNTLNITLSADNKTLEEVLITGYTQVDKRKAATAAAEVKRAEIENVPMPDINQILQGRATGVQTTSPSGQPGARQSVLIRGVGSVNADQQPLYVIDGIIVARGQFNFDVSTQTSDILANLNPNDVENVTILKDATALALYGARGGNGVIVITTKKGKAGTSTLTARAQYGITNPSFGKWKVMNTREAWNYERKVRELAGATPAQLDAEYPDSLLDHGFDWVDATFKNGHTQQYEIVSSGGNDKTKYYLSAGYMKQQGAVIASDFERYSVVSNLQQQVNNRLDISLNLNLSYSTTNNAVAGNRFASPLIAAFSLSPMINPYKPDGSYYKGWEDEWPTPIGDNFLYSTPLNTNINYNFRGLGRISVGYKITDWLKFTQTTAVDMIFTRQKSFYDPTTSDAINLQEPEKSGSIFDGYQQNRAITSQTSLSGGFKWKRDERHEFDFLVMMEYQPTASLNFSAEGQGLVNGKLKVLNVTATPLDVGGAGSDYAFLGYIGQLNYTFNNRYYLTASGRIDGSSRFGADDRYKFFGSVGGSWRISDEPFMKNLAAINDLKLRVSYGTAGNAGFSDFGYKQLYAFGSSYDGAPGSRPSTIGNNELTWEQVATTDLGLEAAVLQSRISASIDLYQRVTTDMLLNVPISATSGFTTRPDNLGKLTNKGVEVTLSSQNLVGNFRWETEINYTLNRNKVNELYKNQDIISGNKIIRVGEPLNSWYMKKWAGVAPEDGDPLWYRADGKTTDTFAASNFRVLGNTQPKYTVGLTNNFSFKGITLSTFFYALKGNVAYNNTRRFSDGDGARFGWNYMKVAGENFWQKAGDIAERPKPVVNGNKLSSSASSRYLEDASYIRLRNVVLAYSLPKAALNALKLNGARVYAQGQNLLTFTKYLGVDPEVGIEGEEFFKYPVSKSYTVGLEITF